MQKNQLIKEVKVFDLFCVYLFFGFRSLRPKQPRPYAQPPSSTVGTASNGNQAYNRAVVPLTHRAVPSMSGSTGVSRTYLNSSSYVAAGNTTMTQVVC